ncbi:hypothetical protein JB92DRAFT_3122860 [Gautieria morchelliformis]|nr:hypothetical protein JB92DRAFT_3122860 [Gautieria morchelliformis]
MASVTLFLDMEAVIRKYWKRLAITNVFGNPSCKRVIGRTIRHICSRIQDSCLGGKTQSLAPFTFESAVKYKTGGLGSHLNPLYSVHNALLGRCTYENPNLVDQVEVEPEDEESTGIRDKDGKK